REVLRGERPKRILVPFVRSKGTPSGKRPHQAGKPETVRLDGQSLRLVGADCVSLASPLRDGASLAHAVAPPLPTKPACAGLWRGPQCNAVPPPFAQGRLSQRSAPLDKIEQMYYHTPRTLVRQISRKSRLWDCICEILDTNTTRRIVYGDHILHRTCPESDHEQRCPGL